MKYLFKNKINILLISLLIVLLSALTYLVFFVDSLDEIIDFKNYKEEEVVDWFKNHNIENYEIIYEYSDNVDEGYTIDQYIDELTKKVVIIISKGIEEVIEVELPIVDGTLNRTELETFFNEFGFTDVSFEYELSDVDKDIVLKINREGKVNINDLIMVTLSSGNSSEDVEVVVPDFSDYTINNIQIWARNNAINLKIEYNVSDTIEKGKVLSQSVIAGNVISASSSLKVVISDGAGITIPDFTNKKKTDVEYWVKEKGVEKITYKEEYSNTISKGYVISIKPNTSVVISSDYPVVVTISKGTKSIVESGYEGKSLSELETYLKTINDTLKLKDSTKRYYSDIYPKDSVYSYDTGEKEDNTSINYSLSLGKFTLNASELNGLSSTKANSIINDYKSKKADITLKTTTVETNEESKIGVTYGCTLNSNVISCNIGVKKILEINASDYNGLSEKDAKAKMNTYFKSYNEGSISFIYGDFSDKPSITYNCSVYGKNSVSCYLYRAKINGNDFNSLTKNEAETKLTNYNNTYNTSYKLTFESIVNDNYTQDKTYGCSISGNNIVCNVALQSEKAEIMNVGSYTYLQKSTYEETKTELENIFDSFTNVTYKAVESKKFVGSIVSITVNGVKNNYEGGSYSINTPIVIEICSKQIN